MSRFISKIAALADAERVEVYPRMLAALFLLGWVFSVLSGPTPLLDLGGSFIGNDFVSFYTGFHLWKSAPPELLYDLPTQLQFQGNLLTVPTEATPFINPPHSVLLYAPFSQGGYLQGLAAWLLFGAACLVAAIALMRSVSPQLSSRSMGQLVLMTVTFFPTLAWLSFGQATMVAMLIWAGTYAALRTDRDFIAGLTLSMLAFKPQLAVPFAIALVASRRWRALAGGALGLTFWGTLTAVLFRPQFVAWVNKLSTITEMLRAEDYPTWGIHSWFGFSNLLVYPIVPALADPLTFLLSATTVAAVIVLWWRTEWRPGTVQWDGSIAVTLALMPLAGVHFFTYDQALMMIPFFIVLALPQCQRDDVYMDGDQILGWSAVVYVACFVSGYLSLGQQTLTESIGMPSFAIQISVFAVIGWSYVVWRSTHGAPSRYTGPN